MRAHHYIQPAALREIYCDWEDERGRARQRKKRRRERERVWIKASQGNSHSFSLWREAEMEGGLVSYLFIWHQRASLVFFHLSTLFYHSSLSLHLTFSNLSFSSLLLQTVYLSIFSPLNPAILPFLWNPTLFLFHSPPFTVSFDYGGCDLNKLLALWFYSNFDVVYLA